jgi:hypothetical protein
LIAVARFAGATRPGYKFARAFAFIAPIGPAFIEAAD